MGSYEPRKPGNHKDSAHIAHSPDLDKKSSGPRNMATRPSLKSANAIAALAYASAGWRVFPVHTPMADGGCSCGRADCSNPGKHPRTKGGFKDATSDEAQVAQWWSQWPNANIGGIPGSAGFVVVDVDGPQGEATADLLELTPTREVRTGRGRHLYYRHPGGTIGNQGPGPGIDLRADNGYVLLPPSLHHSGRRYQWTDETVPIAAFSLFAAGTAANDHQSLGAAEGERNTKLFKYLSGLRRQGADADHLHEAAVVWNEACIDPLDRREVLDVVKQVAKYASIVDQLNATYAYVLIGNKECVLEEGLTEDGQPTLEILSLEAFRGWHREFTIPGPTNSRTGRRSPIPIATVWLDSPFKRKYRTVEFAPPPRKVPSDTYNLFRGLAVEPNDTGDCSLFLDHLRTNVCQDDEAAYAWTLGWFAQLIQAPAYKPGTCLALRGKQGVGKSKVGEVIKRLLGPYHFTASSPHQVTGHFNAHLRNCLLLQAEEAFWAGDVKAEGVLKDLITSDTLRIEFKGKDILTVRNCIRLLVTSNADWVVPVDFDDRRFTVIDVGEKRKKDFEYFKAMDEQLAAGGYGKLLGVLQSHTYDERALRGNLDTGAGREQKLHSLTDLERWLVDVATEGVLPGDGFALGETICSTLHGHYKAHAQSHRARRILGHAEFGIQIAKWFGDGRRIRRREESGLVWKYVLPELGDFRAILVKRMQGLEASWDMDEAWEPDPSASGRGDGDEF